jgi:crotonobetaine/carnitine-CoA ligase
MPAMLRPLQVLRLYAPHEGTLATLLATRVAVAPERDALVFEDRTIGYEHLHTLAQRAAAMYAARGVGAGDRIGVMSTNHPSTVITLLALARLGAVMVPVNPDYRATEAGYVFGHAQVSGVLSAPEALATVHEAVRDLAPTPWLMLNRAAAGTELPVFDDEVARAPADAPADAQTPDAPCVFVYTSGTTGFPKGVMHGQRTLILAGEGFVQRMVLQPDDRLLAMLPMFHINALFYSLAGALAAGATLILLDNMDLHQMRQAVGLTVGRAALEASGGVRLDTVRAIAETGVDRISIGTLTKDVRAIDLSLRHSEG